MYNNLSRLMLVLSDAIAFMLAFVFSGTLAEFVSEKIMHVSYSPFVGYTDSTYISIFAAVSLLGVFIFYNRGHYTQRTPWWEQVRYIILVSLFLLMVNGFVHYAVQEPFSRLWIFIFSFSAMFMVMFCRQIVRGLSIKLGIWNLPTIVVGNGDNVLESLYAINSDIFTGFDIKEIVILDKKVPFDKDSLPTKLKNIPIVTVTKGVTDVLEEYKDCYMVFAFESASKESEEVLKWSKDACVKSAYVPANKVLPLYGQKPQYFFGHNILFLNIQRRAHSPFGKIFKRFVDVVGSLAALTLLSPLFLVVMAKLKLEGGNVFFGHKRIGKNGKPFFCLKFRSMVPNAQEVLQELLESDPAAKKEWERDFKLKNDPRVTRIGKFIREKSIDELPQIINVLKGDMSLVGPRPIVEDEVAYYDDKFHYYKQVKPGITGLWQVSGRNDTTYSYRVYLDAWYVKNWSVWQDIVILFKTVGILLTGKGAY